MQQDIFMPKSFINTTKNVLSTAASTFFAATYVKAIIKTRHESAEHSKKYQGEHVDAKFTFRMLERTGYRFLNCYWPLLLKNETKSNISNEAIQKSPPELAALIESAEVEYEQAIDPVSSKDRQTPFPEFQKDRGQGA